MNHENSQTLNPSQNFRIKNRPWFPKQRPENDEKQELVRVALVKAKIVSELNSQKLEQKANRKKGLTRDRVEKYALVWAPQKCTSSSTVVILRICVFFVGFENLGEFACIFWIFREESCFFFSKGEHPNTGYKTSYRHIVTASIHTHHFRARFCGSHFRLVHTILRSSGLKSILQGVSTSPCKQVLQKWWLGGGCNIFLTSIFFRWVWNNKLDDLFTSSTSFKTMLFWFLTGGLLQTPTDSPTNQLPRLVGEIVTRSIGVDLVGLMQGWGSQLSWVAFLSAVSRV